MNRLFALPFLLALAGTAAAVPLALQHQGRLVGADGAAIDGPHQLTFALYDAPEGGSPLWTESQEAALTDGFFGVRLGESAALDAGLLAGSSPRYLGIAVDGGAELSPRILLSSTPYAVMAHGVSGGPVDASELKVNGTTVVNSAGELQLRVPWTAIDGAPPDEDSLADLACVDGEVPTFDGGIWSCGAAGSDTFDAAAVTSGTFDVARLPVGAGPSEVAAGNHAHAFAEITGTVGFAQLPTGTGADQVAAGNHAHAFGDLTGQLAFSQIPVGTGANQVAAGNHTHTAAAVGALPIGGGTLTGALVAQSGVQLGAPTTCNTAAVGTLRFNSGGDLEVCGPAGWEVIHSTSNDGSSAQKAGRSCKSIKSAKPSATSGVYWIDPDGTGSQPAFEVYCDQTTSGGGWTLVMKLSAGSFCYGSSRWTDGQPLNPTRMLDAVSPGVNDYDAKSMAFHQLRDVRALRFQTQRGQVTVSFTADASPQNLMTTNNVAFAAYPDYAQWRATFAQDRSNAPIFMRGGQFVLQGNTCRTNVGSAPSGCGQLCVFCYQAADGSSCPAPHGANDVNSGVGNHPNYCGGGTTTQCSTGSAWSDLNNRTLIWAQ